MIAPAEKPAGPAASVIITAARLRAHGQTWEAVAEKTGRPARELMQFTLKNPDVWNPLADRAEKLRLAEAEGHMLRRLVEMAADGSEAERERAAREILVHRRFIARGRNKPPRRQEELQEEKPRPSVEKERYPQWLVQEPPPEKRDLFYAAHCVSRGASWRDAAKDMKENVAGVLLWPFVHPRSWDRAYVFARLESARAAAALAVSALENLADYGTEEAAVGAAHTLLVHRRRMGFACPGGQRAKPGRVPDGPSGPRGGEVTSQNRTRDGAIPTVCHGRQKTSFRRAARDGGSCPAENPGGPEESRGSAGAGGREPEPVSAPLCALCGEKENPRGPARPRDGPG